MRLGIALFVLGSILLLYSLGLLTEAQISLLFPTLLIIAGIALMLQPAYRCGKCLRSSWRNVHRCKDCARQWCGKGDCSGCDICDGVPQSTTGAPMGVSAGQ